MRFKTIRQRDAMQCGVACLAMICRHYGSHVSLDEVERACPPSREALSP